MAKKKSAIRKKTAPPPRKKAARRTATAAAPADPVSFMVAPKSGVTIRMYRQGHGDCFLLAFRDPDGQPFHMLIDCGMKKGSTPDDARSMKEVVAHIKAATNNHLHLAVVTHEHEDHVSGLPLFSEFKLDRLWLAWTEDPDDELANQLRDQFHDTLIGLVAASTRLHRIGASNASHVTAVVDDMLGYSLSDDDRKSFAAAASKSSAAKDKIAGLTNKTAIKVLRDQARKIEYLTPHTKPRPLMGVKPADQDYRVFVLGPPKNLALLRDMDPQGDEEFHLAAAVAEEHSFFAAVGTAVGQNDPGRPFADADTGITVRDFTEVWSHFRKLAYNHEALHPVEDAAWRRIAEKDWLAASETFALRMGNMINNTSLVLAFELPQSQKILLFAADAQRGNWISWAEKSWKGADGEEISITDLLNRTVFYKVGHHGSHNATMNAGGLAEMAAGPFANDFTAMIPAHEKWALNVKPDPWVHPDPHILKALQKKTKGRVIRLDKPLKKKPTSLSEQQWKDFTRRYKETDYYREFTVADDA